MQITALLVYSNFYNSLIASRCGLDTSDRIVLQIRAIQLHSLGYDIFLIGSLEQSGVSATCCCLHFQARFIHWDTFSNLASDKSFV